VTPKQREALIITQLRDDDDDDDDDAPTRQTHEINRRYALFGDMAKNER
jgi:hypothetical protein